MRKVFSDPKVQQAHADAAKIDSQHDRVFVQLPDAAKQRALSEAVRYFQSPAFQSQRNAIIQATELAEQRLGPAGLAAAERIATRRTVTDESQEQVADRIEAGQVAELLETAAELAASPEIQETIEQADLEALVQLDEDQTAERVTSESEASTGSDSVDYSAYSIEYYEFTKEELLEMHQEALLLLLPLEAALAWLTVSNPGSPVFATLLVVVGGLIAFVLFSQAVISRWDD